MGFLIMYMIVSSVLDAAITDNQMTGYQMADDIFRVLKFIVDIYIIQLFFRLFIYLFNMRKERFEEKNKTLSKKDLFIKGWTIFLAVLTFIQSFLAVYEVVNRKDAFIWFAGICDRYAVPIKDFLVFITMLYLFYS